MKETAWQVYYSLQDLLLPEYRLPWVENVFGDNMECTKAYKQVYDANVRLCDRLGQPDEDTDVEIIINSLFEIQQILCLKMFEYGVRYAKENPQG